MAKNSIIDNSIDITFLSKEDIEGNSSVLQKVMAGCGEAYWTMPQVNFAYWKHSKEFCAHSSDTPAYNFLSDGYGVRPASESDNQDYDDSFETSPLYSYLNSECLNQLLDSAEVNRVNDDMPDDIKRIEALLTRQEKLQAESVELDAKMAGLTRSLSKKRMK